MNIYIVDASVAAKWFFEENYTKESLRLLDERKRLYAPDFFLIEMDNLLCKRIRRGKIREKEGHQIRGTLRQFPIQYHAFSELIDPAYEIANRTGRSLYDCLYIALAALLNGQMVTADRRLYEGLTHGPFAKHLLWIEDLKT